MFGARRRPEDGRLRKQAASEAGCEVVLSGKVPARVVSLSIIIPTLNEEGHVDSLLSDIAGQTTVPAEILVVDAGSNDGTSRVVGRFSFVELL